MKTWTFSFVLMVGMVSSLQAQTLFTPGGSANIGNISGTTVGIGTSSPSGLSTLPNLGYGNPVVNGFGVLDNWGGQATPITAVFKAVDGSSYQELDILSKNIGGPATLLRGRYGSSADVFWVTLGGGAFFGGNVGIGNSNPAAKLEVQTTANGLNIIEGLRNGDGTESGGNAVGLGFLNEGGGDWWKAAIVHERTGSYGVGKLHFLVDDRASASPVTLAQARMTITQTGNVGIGTTNPTYPLSVNGTIQAKEVIVQTGWSDYVFDEHYPLAPLSEVESHIKAEKHLPGIPSAQEVAAKGISVGEMQAKLLAKIEELTLHQIEQEKEIAAQKTQLSAQATRIERLEAENANLKRQP